MLRIATIGTSSVMDVIQEAIRLTDGLVCQVIYSRDQARGEAYAAKNGVENVCTDLDELVKRDDVDIIYIASPNSCHAGQAEKALESGKHVIVEKPLALTRGDVDRLYSLARKNGVYLFEAITTLFMPNYEGLRSLLPSIGKVGDANLRYGQYSSKMDAYKKGIAASSLDPAMGGGALNDLGIYCIHAAIDMFGIPAGVKYAPELGENGVDLEGSLTLDYGHFTCDIVASKSRDIGSGCSIEGEDGVLIEEGPINDFASCRAVIRGESFDISVQPEGNRMVYEMERFRDAILARDEAFHHRMHFQSRAAAGVLEDAAR